MSRLGLAPSRRVLGNGVRVIAKSTRTIPAVHLLLTVDAGGYCDPPDRDGTAALTARVLDRGTTTRSADVIADTLDRRGASVSVVAGRHQMAIGATCLTDDFAVVLDLIADIARRPVFPDVDVATRRAELITSIRQEEDDPATMAGDAFMRALYGMHPYARKVRGTVASVERLTRDELAAFQHRFFLPASVAVAIVGDIAEDAAMDAVSGALGDWAGGTEERQAVPEAPRPGERRFATVPMPDKAQADVAYGFVGVRRSDADYVAAVVMNNALGQYAMGGRLGDSIRERQGMAYYVFSALDADVGPGPLLIRAGVAAENVERTIASIDAELATILRDGFTTAEIAESKQYLIGSLSRQLETNAAIAAFLLTAEQFGLGLDYDLRLPDLLRGVTHDMAMAAAHRLLDPARATVAVAGPWAPGAGPTA